MWIWLGLSGLVGLFMARRSAREWSFVGEPRRGVLDGERLAYELHSRRHGNARVDRVALSIADGLEFRITAEGSFARLLHRLGVGREIETGIASFDQRFEIQCNESRLGPWLRDTASARSAIEELFEMGASEIVAHRARLFVTRAAIDQGPQNDEAAQRAACALSQLVSCLPAELAGAEGRAPASVWRRAIPLTLWTYTLLALAPLLWWQSLLDEYPATVNTGAFAVRLGLYAALFVPLILFLAARWMRDSIIARLVLLEFVILGIPAFLGVSVLAGLEINQRWASGPVLVQSTTVWDKDMDRRRGSISHYVVVEPWTELAGPARIPVERETYRQLRALDQVEVTWQQGALGQALLLEPPRALPR